MRTRLFSFGLAVVSTMMLSMTLSSPAHAQSITMGTIGGTCAGTWIDFFIQGGTMECGQASIPGPSSWTFSTTPNDITWPNGNYDRARVRWNSSFSGGWIRASYSCTMSGSGTIEINPLTISPSVVPNVTLSFGSSNLCPGGSVQLIATPVSGGGSNPTYSYYINGGIVHTGSEASYTHPLGSLEAGGHTATVVMASNAPCPSPTGDDDTKTFTITTPTPANAGPDQTGASTCGLTVVNISGNTPSSGTGLWTIVGGINGVLGNPNSPNTTLTGIEGTAYTLRWTISNPPCATTFDDVNITFNRIPPTANAGPDQTGIATCGLTMVTLAANSPTPGSGSWSVISGSGGSFTLISNPTTNFSGVAGATYTLRWTVSNSPCGTTTDDVQIAFNMLPTTANAGPDQQGPATCGLTSVNLAANAPAVGTAAWSIISGAGGSVTTPNSPTSAFTGTAGSTYQLRWTISSGPCTASTDDVFITFNRSPTMANAGADQTGASTCGQTVVNLSANAPSFGIGLWTIVGGINGVLGNPNSPNTTLTGIEGTAYVLRWTITSSPCTSSYDEVSVTFNRYPSTANAGPDQTGVVTCGLTTINLAAATPTYGTGSWTVLSGTGGSFGLISNPTSTFTGTAGSPYTLRWTVSSAGCGTSSDDVAVTLNRFPTTANAGPDRQDATTCGLTSLTLAANAAAVGTSSWSIIAGAGGSIIAPTSPTSNFTGTAGASYQLRWSITNGPCGTSTDDVFVTLNQNPTTANAGPDQTGPSTCGQTVVNLSANPATAGIGLWTIVGGIDGVLGNANSPNTTLTGIEGTSYTLRWTINSFPCTASYDEVSVSFNKYPSVADAGLDLTGVVTCGLSTINLAAVTPTYGTGSWTIVTGTGGSFGLISNPSSTFTGSPNTPYTLRWTVSSAGCGTSSDDVQVILNRFPTTANAGPDRQDATTCGLTSLNLAANTGVVGTGSWSIIAGAGGNFQEPSNPLTLFSGNAGTTYQLRWSITNSPCGTSTDDAFIRFNAYPTPALAGPDQSTCGQTRAYLSANVPTAGTGFWTIESGINGVIDNSNNASTFLDGISGTNYVLRWNITNNPCAASTDDIFIAFPMNPTASEAGPDQNSSATCGQTSVTLAANVPSNGSGAWSIVSGEGGAISSPYSPSSVFEGDAGSTYILKWSITNSPCTTSEDEVTVTFNQVPTPSDAGPNQAGPETCGLTTLTLAGSVPTVGTGQWSIVSGEGATFQAPSSPTSAISGVGGTTYILRWTITNAPCQLTADDVLIHFNLNPTTMPTITGNVRFAEGTFDLVASGGAAGEGYQWFNAAGEQQLGGALFTTPLVSATTSNYAYVKAIGINSCLGQPKWTNVIIHPLPVITSSVEFLTFGGMATLSTGTYNSYSWNFNFGGIVATTPTYQTGLPGLYTVTVTLDGVSGTSLPYNLKDQFGGQQINYVVTYDIQNEGITKEIPPETLAISDALQTVQYFDGLGRPLQTIATQASPSESDIVSPVRYDAHGRPYRKFLPVTVGSDGRYKTDIISNGQLAGEVASFYNSPSNNIADDPAPYADTHFEPSPLNRVLEQGSPGVPWQPQSAQGHPIKQFYHANAAQEVLLFKYDNISGQVTLDANPFNRYYAEKRLFANKTLDEDNKETLEYTDNDGRTVCRKVRASPTEYACTYYIYDELGNLVIVLPPEAIKKILSEL